MWFLGYIHLYCKLILFVYNKSIFYKEILAVSRNNILALVVEKTAFVSEKKLCRKSNSALKRENQEFAIEIGILGFTKERTYKGKEIPRRRERYKCAE